MRTRSGSSADDSRRDSWKKIFKGLVDLIQDQQRQLESFVKERKSLEKRIQSQHDRWVFDVKLLEDHISQMTRDSKIKDMTRFVEAAKANLIISMKNKEAIMHKLKFEDVDDERVDLKLLFDELSQLLADPKRATRSSSKCVDESALKAERDFAWNQFKRTDAKLQEHVQRTKSEVQAANDKVQKLILELENSQSSNLLKDRTISALQDDIAVLKSDSRKKSEEISRLTKELELLRGDSSRSITPVLRRCMVVSGTSGLGDKNSHSNDSSRSITPVLRHCMVVSGTSGLGDKNSHSNGLAVMDKGGRISKRKASKSEPRLFTSRFKVPKLKNSSPL